MQLPSDVKAQAEEHALQLQPVAIGDTNLGDSKVCSSVYSWLATINASKSLQLPRTEQRSVGCSYKSLSGKKCRRPLEEIDTNMASSAKRLRGRGGKASSSVGDAIGEEEEEEEDNSKTPTRLPPRRSTRRRSHGQDSSAGGFTDAKLNTME